MEAAKRKKSEREKYRDRIRGSLLGGAVGDALGYPVEFMDYKQICRKYGPGGIQSYAFDFKEDIAVISDDTQMTLFTANGILYGETRECLRGIRGKISDYVAAAYRDWYRTQMWARKDEEGCSWLMDIPELHVRRAPGNTCLSALSSDRMGSIENPVNHSKGCGGIMRVAPLGLHYDPLNSEKARKSLDRDGAQLAAITHGHPLGYIPAAILVHLVNVGIYGGCTRGDTLADCVHEAMETAEEIFGRDEHMKVLQSLMNQAELLASNDRPDEENIRKLGEGWIAEETLAISVYCCLKYPDDFSKAVTVSVNHNGDSDSTGAVTGNIMGAWLGYEAIEEKWKRNLELKKIILEMADDLCYGCLMSEYSSYCDPVWESKYVTGKYMKQN